MFSHWISGIAIISCQYSSISNNDESKRSMLSDINVILPHENDP